MSTRTKAIIGGTICAIAGISIIVFFSYRCIKYNSLSVRNVVPARRDPQ